MNTERILELRRRIKSLTKELDSCVDELAILVEGDLPDTGATSDEMGIHNQLSQLIGKKG